MDRLFIMPKITFAARFKQKLEEYGKKYDIEGLDSGNDKANLEVLLKNEILIEDLQQSISDLAEKSTITNIGEIKKLSDVLRDLIDKNLALEKVLAIDRKSRKLESTAENPAEYIKSLKFLAKEFIDKRLEKLYCPDCSIMVFRYASVHEHTAYSVEVQCSQCNKTVRATRKEKDVFYDLAPSDRAWRKKYPVEVEKAKNKSAPDIIDIEDDLIIGQEE